MWSWSDALGELAALLKVRSLYPGVIGHLYGSQAAAVKHMVALSRSGVRAELEACGLFLDCADWKSPTKHPLHRMQVALYAARRRLPSEVARDLLTCTRQLYSTAGVSAAGATAVVVALLVIALLVIRPSVARAGAAVAITAVAIALRPWVTIALRPWVARIGAAVAITAVTIALLVIRPWSRDRLYMVLLDDPPALPGEPFRCPAPDLIEAIVALHHGPLKLHWRSSRPIRFDGWLGQTHVVVEIPGSFDEQPECRPRIELTVITEDTAGVAALQSALRKALAWNTSRLDATGRWELLWHQCQTHYSIWSCMELIEMLRVECSAGDKQLCLDLKVIEYAVDRRELRRLRPQPEP